MRKNTAADLNDPWLPTVFDQLLEPVDEFVRNQDRELPKHHNQKFSYYDFFRLLMYFFVSEGKSLKLFIVTKLNKGLLAETLQLRPVPYSTFGEAFERFPVTLFQAVFQHLLSTVAFRAIPELTALGRLYCIDGSLFPVISSMLWAEYTSKHPSLKLHLCFELNRMLPVEFLVTAANFSEREALLNMLKSGITYIADRGYMSF
ncbi:MAG: transposase, partial [bacterium]|nr:transposase [bacterium]